MKRTSTLLGLLLVAGTMVAQRTHVAPRPHSFAPAVNPEKPAAPGQAKDGGDVVWGEDFANGLAGNNPSGAWSTDLVNGDLWVHTTTGPNGAYSNSTESINSATDPNGWMIFQSDSGNSTFLPDTIIANSVFVNWDGALVSPVIDLSATPYVRLQYQQRMRYCCGTSPFFLEISTDGGGTWPTRIDLVTEGANVDPGTQTKTYNITEAISANPSTVRFRFYHDGTFSQTSHYHWQIDDIQIIEVFPNDLSIIEASHYFFDLNTSATYDSLNYTVYPWSQLRPLPLHMTAMNNGSVQQTGVTANFLVQEGANTVLDQDQVIATWDQGVTQTVFVDPDFTPPAVDGTYDVTYTLSSALNDTTPADNTESDEFDVMQYIYGRDGGSAMQYEDGDGDDGPYVLGNVFQIVNDVELTAVDVAFRNGPGVAGSVVIGGLHAMDGSFSLLDNTEEYELQASDLNGTGGGNFVHLVFNDPVQLFAGDAVMVSVETYGGSTVRTGVNGISHAQTSFIYYDPPPPSTLPLDWYYTTSTPMVRMNFDPTVGLGEHVQQEGIFLGQCYPNPGDAGTTIPYRLEQPATVKLSIHDLSGQLVMDMFPGRQGTGNHRLEVPTVRLSEGAYFYTLKAGDIQLTRPMTVVH